MEDIWNYYKEAADKIAFKKARFIELLFVSAASALQKRSLRKL